MLSKDRQGISLNTSSPAQKPHEVGRSRSLESGQESEAKGVKQADSRYNNTTKYNNTETPTASKRAPTVEGEHLLMVVVSLNLGIGLMIHTHVHVHILNPVEPNWYAITSLSSLFDFADVLTCCLCEIGADIKLLPCGHVALCHNCVVSGQGAKKCPMIECRVSRL